MSSSENRIIKDAKISSSPIVIVMHDFADLSGVETESTDFVEEIDDSITQDDAGQPLLAVKPRLDVE